VALSTLFTRAGARNGHQPTHRGIAVYGAQAQTRRLCQAACGGLGKSRRV